jgi:hypothetical protein
MRHEGGALFRTFSVTIQRYSDSNLVIRGCQTSFILELLNTIAETMTFVSTITRIRPAFGCGTP